MLRRSRRGAGRWGCLLSIALIALAVYYGIGFGKVYFTYWQLKDEMNSQARVASGLRDETIRNRLEQKANDLNLPPEAYRFTIRRLARPKEIRLSTSYEVTVKLPPPFYVWRHRFTPEARAPL